MVPVSFYFAETISPAPASRLPFSSCLMVCRLLGWEKPESMLTFWHEKKITGGQEAWEQRSLPILPHFEQMPLPLPNFLLY